MLASIVIPVLNDSRILRCVRSVLDQSLTRDMYEVIVVDNGSDKISTPHLLKGLPITLLREERPGISAAVNCGLAHASGEFLVRIDADCVATGDWLKELLEPFSERGVGAVGGTVYKEPGSTWVEVAGRNFILDDQLGLQFLPMFPAPYVVTANAAYRLDLIRMLGGFDEQFFSSGDVDISWRIHLAGFQIRTVPSAIVYHPNRPTLRKYFLQFYTYGLGHALLFKKYRKITGKRFLVNVYPFQGLLRLASKDIPQNLILAMQKRESDRILFMKLFLDFVEYIALVCGDVRGAVKFRVPYL